MTEIYLERLVRDHYRISATSFDAEDGWETLDTCGDDAPGLWQCIEIHAKDEKSGREAWHCFDIAYCAGDTCLECQPVESWFGTDADYFEAISGYIFDEVYSLAEELARILKPAAERALTEATKCTA